MRGPEYVRFWMERVPMFERQTPWAQEGPRPARETDRFRYKDEWASFEEDLNEASPEH
jgi:hypothetical protein